MDPFETRRLLQIIKANGHKVVYDPKTREELDQWGLPGAGETALGSVDVRPWDGKSEQTMILCTVILAGEMPTLPDNVVEPCAWTCGRMVQHRPWCAKELQKVCLYCAAERKVKDQ